MFGVVETVFYLAIGAGSILAALLVEGLGARWALALVGLFLPVLVLGVHRRILRIDERATVAAHEIELLGLLPMFAPLPPLALERLARELKPVEVAAGTEVVVQGDPGDLFYAIDEGQFEVFVDKEPVAMLGHGEGFGEIALLRDQPRMATVVARTDAKLFALEREVFLVAVTGYSESENAANALVVARLSSVLGRA